LKDQKFAKPIKTFGNTLRLTPYAYAKLIWMRDKGDTEVAGYATTATNDPLLVTDFRLIKQECTEASFEFDPNDIAKDVENMLDKELAPWQTHNILIHTHPGNSADPSIVDENNFRNSFANPDWAIMFIIANDGSTYCRIKANVGPGVERQLGVSIDWKAHFCESNVQAWEDEYKLKVTKIQTVLNKTKIQGVNTELSKLIYHSAIDNITDNCWWGSDGNVIFWNEENQKWYEYDPINGIWYIGSDKDDSLTELAHGLKPCEPWVNSVIKWAEDYADERQDAIDVDDEFMELMNGIHS